MSGSIKFYNELRVKRSRRLPQIGTDFTSFKLVGTAGHVRERETECSVNSVKVDPDFDGNHP